MTIRNAVEADLPRLLEIIEIAKKFMAETGNPTEGRTGGPTKKMWEEDMKERKL